MFVHKFIPGKKGMRRSLLLLHGTGGDENGLLPLAGAVAPGFPVLSVRGKVQESGMNRFFRRFADGSFDLQDLAFRAGELADFVEGARKDYDLGRVYALGFSNGANIAAAILLLRPETLEGAVLFRPQVPLVPDRLPDLKGKRILICSGRSDHMVGPEEPVKLESMLRRAGAEVSLDWEDAGHNLTDSGIRKAKKWLSALD